MVRSSLSFADYITWASLFSYSAGAGAEPRLAEATACDCAASLLPDAVCCCGDQAIHIFNMLPAVQKQCRQVFPAKQCSKASWVLQSCALLMLLGKTARLSIIICMV